jgi:hypothetical protein
MVKMAAEISIEIVADTSELECDLERIEAGDLTLPTVSAVSLLIDGRVIEDVPVYLG